tara:strand:- start:5467 stop:6540 length:1074 start_codon:yes stop_codon:yes gene_type:complete
MLKLYTYRLPFKTAFRTAGLVLENREGLVLVFEHNGITAFGEIAPLPGFSKFTLHHIIPIIELNRAALETALIEDDFDQFSFVLYQIHDIPSLKFGLDTLAYDYKSKKAGLSLAKYLFKEAYRKKIEVNGTLGISDLDSTLLLAEGLVRNGFETLKVKVGVDFGKELEILNKLRKQFPEIKIRIDANQSWGFDEAVINLKKCENLDIEYCEEPLIKDYYERLSELKNQIKINLAADESFRNKEDANRLAEQNIVDTFILKPMLFGSFSEINVTKELSNSHYNRLVFTTSLESKIGRTVTAILASGWGATKKAHGLSTGSLLKYDLGTNQEINSGFFQIPQKPGIGIDLNYKYLKEII